MDRLIHRWYRPGETKQLEVETIVEHGDPFPESWILILIMHLLIIDHSSNELVEIRIAESSIILRWPSFCLTKYSISTLRK